jgi:hypothetical protein
LCEESKALLERLKLHLDPSPAAAAAATSFKSLCLSTRFNTEGFFYQRCDWDVGSGGCGHVTETVGDVYGMLGLEIISPTSSGQNTFPTRLHGFLSEYCSGEHLPERLCPGVDCGKIGSTMKYFVVSTAPSELILHIQRNIYNNITGVQSRDNSPVTFPSVLQFSECGKFPQCFYPYDGEPMYNIYPNSLSGVLAESPLSPNVFNVMDEDIIQSVPKSKLQYELTSVIRHSGDSINRGHYVIDVCSRSADNVKCWTRYDDDKERPTSEVYRYNKN